MLHGNLSTEDVENALCQLSRPQWQELAFHLQQQLFAVSLLSLFPTYLTS